MSHFTTINTQINDIDALPFACVKCDDYFARDKLVNGLSQLRETDADLAQQDVSGIVASFGKMGQRRFQLAA